VNLLLSNEARPVSAEAYFHSLQADGPAPYPGSAGTFWQRHESISMVRFPLVELTPPSPAEIRRVLWRAPAAAAEFLAPVAPGRPGNSVLYTARREDLPLALSTQARQNIRRAERELTFEFIDATTLRAHGVAAFCETRTRIGLSDGTPAHFELYAQSYDRIGRHFLAAWHDGVLVAFLALTVVDDYVYVEGSFSLTEARILRPNDGLAATVFEHFLEGGRCQAVSYGLASLRQQGEACGLHRFKINIGLTATPVRRCFAVHPLLRPGVNRLSLKSTEKLVTAYPGSRAFRKASHVLHALVM
jgi:hypothetical protein